MKIQLSKFRDRIEDRLVNPALLWVAGAPIGPVVLLWFYFMRNDE